MKKILMATVVVFVAWVALDWIMHGMILQSAYASTPTLWRPMQEMKMGTLYFAVLMSALAFTWIYAKFVGKKSMGTGLAYGLWSGFGTGVGMGYGTYAVMPIPYMMAFVWFAGTVVEAGVAGIIVGSMIKE